MPTEPNLPAGEPVLGRAREEGGRSADLFTRLDRSRVFRPAMILGTALMAGLFMAPQLLTQSYPTDFSLLGAPAAANYKAPHDIEVVDEEATEHLREAAVADVRRVYDFDTQMGEKRAGAVEKAFSAMRASLEALVADHPELGSDRRTQAQIARLRDGLSAALPDFEKALGTSLTPEQAERLAAEGYDAEIGILLSQALHDAMSQPLVAERATLEPDRGRGITIDRVPDDHSPPRAVNDIDSIPDLDSMRREFPLRVRKLFPDAPAPLRELVALIGARALEANLTPNRAATEDARVVARLAVKPVTITVKKGEMITRDGERLTRRHLLVFRAISKQSGGASIVLVALGAALTVLLLIAVGIGWGPGRVRKLVFSGRDVCFLATLFLSGLAMARVWSIVAAALHDRYALWPLEAFMFMLPFAAGAMMTRLVLKTNVAVWFAVLSSLVLGLIVEAERPFVLYAAVGSIVAATRLRTITARGDLLRAGVTVGLGQAAAALVIQLFSGQTSVVPYLLTLPAAFAGGIFSAVVALALTPVAEAAFGYTTDLKLLELANLNHPALKELIVQAPGSYHHSVIVGALVEAAAEAIGANPLLARVMAYYHDLGKGCNPLYFIENQRNGQNPHDKLKPSMSAMIIKRHVTDGLEIAKRYHLGGPITAAIAEHHGTTLIHYFHHKAKELAEDPESISESDYRYPGRRPQSREAALVMLGDSVEAAARSLPDPTPARLAGVVNRIVNLRFADEQLEECDITLKDLHLIAKSFSTVLSSIYHTRPEYPELLKDLSGGKKANGDTDSKQLKAPKDIDSPPEDNRPDNLRRLGLS